MVQCNLSFICVADSLANSLLLKDDKAFWTSIKKLNSSNTVQATTIDNVTGAQPITDMWQAHYKNLLNSSKDASSKDAVLSALGQKDRYVFERFSVNNVMDAVRLLKLGKSCGKDSIYAEHVKFAHDKVSVILSMLFNAMFIHGFVPKVLMDTLISPIVKDKKGNITDKNNYRPIAITSIFSKLLELIILKKYGELLSSTFNQFGFKEKLSTDLCVYSLKQIIEYYHSLSTPVYIVFMDASKAFDKVNHFHLMLKLIQRRIPIIIVRLLLYWYSHQEFFIRWSNVISEPFTVINGVRQGGIASPFYFNIYLDNLSNLLSNAGVGCSINSLIVNHLFYADDSILMAPSLKALQQLINICVDYARDHELVYNVKKTKMMYLKPKKSNCSIVSDVYMYGHAIERVSSYKYLGVIIDECYCDNDDILRQTRCIYARGNVLIKNFVMCSNEVKSKLFKSYCSTFYCSHLWSSYYAVPFKQLHTAYNRVFRSLFQFDRYSSVSQKCIEYGVDSFSVLIRKAIFSFRTRLLSNDNPIIKAITSSTFYLSCLLTKKWNKLLFTF